MNCTAWNSVRANALTKRPSAIPSTALQIAIAITSATEPSVSSPSSPNATTDVIEAWRRGAGGGGAGQKGGPGAGGGCAPPPGHQQRARGGPGGAPAHNGAGVA